MTDQEFNAQAAIAGRCALCGGSRPKNQRYHIFVGANPAPVCLDCYSKHVKLLNSGGSGPPDSNAA